MHNKTQQQHGSSATTSASSSVATTTSTKSSTTTPPKPVFKIQKVSASDLLLPVERKNFPQRLMDILDDSESKHLDVIKWLPNGRGFIILKKDKFVKNVLPKYFQNCKFESFTRNLNRWGFHRVSREAATAGAYHHKLFRRDQPWMCNQMIVGKIPSGSGGQAPSQFQRTIFQQQQNSAPVPIAPANTTTPAPANTATNTTGIVQQHPTVQASQLQQVQAQQQVQQQQQSPATNLLQLQAAAAGLLMSQPQVLLQPQQVTLQQQQQLITAQLQAQQQAQQQRQQQQQQQQQAQAAAAVGMLLKATQQQAQQTQQQAQIQQQFANNLQAIFGSSVAQVLQQQQQQQPSSSSACALPSLFAAGQQAQQQQQQQQLQITAAMPTTTTPAVVAPVVNNATPAVAPPTDKTTPAEEEVEVVEKPTTTEEETTMKKNTDTDNNLKKKERWIAAPMHPEEEARIEVLEACEVLDTEPENRYDHITMTAKHSFAMPIVLVSLVDKDRQWFKSVQGIDAKETPRDQAFCAHAIHGDDVFCIPDASKDYRFADNPLVADPNGPQIRFYAGVPLRVGNVNIGTLCLIDSKPRNLDVEQKRVLKNLGALVEKELNKTLSKSKLSKATITKLAIAA